MGKQLLIDYHTRSAKLPRQRWFNDNRYSIVKGNVEQLPRYKRQVCPPVEFDEPIPFSREEHGNGGCCVKCGERLNFVVEWAPYENGVRVGENKVKSIRSHSSIVLVDGKEVN
jgi:hypothetical protein